MCSVGWLKGVKAMPAKAIVDRRRCILLSLGPVKCVCLLSGTESQQDFLARHCCNAAFLLPF